MKMISPFRYPGAKNRLVNEIFSHLDWEQDISRFVDVFVGGGSVTIFTLLNYGFSQYVVNDKDDGMAAFWECVTDNDLSDDLCRMIIDTVPTVEEHKKQREKRKSVNVVEKAFATLFLNRTSFSGIITSGPIGGDKQQSKYSVGCRYNPERLVVQVKMLHEAFGELMHVRNRDFSEVLEEYDEAGVLFYCDPPYYVKGASLYPCKMSIEEHQYLADSLRRLKNATFILSYDNAPVIREMYDWATIYPLDARYSIEGQNRESWKQDSEIVIFGGI